MQTSAHLVGLSRAEAAARLRVDGPNQLPRKPPRTLLDIGLEVVREPMFQLLVLAGLIYLVIGDIGEALMLLCFVQISILIAVVQEKRAESALEALRELANPHALVIRDGQQQTIDSRQLVRGDLIVLIEGDRVAADAILLTANNLQVDESLLTGESVPVIKRIAADGLASDLVYSGTMVVSGHGVAQVSATGMATEIGKIGRSLRDIEDEPTRLHAQTQRFVRIFGSIGLVLSIVTTLVMGAIQGDWLQGLLSGITLAMSILPEEFAVVLTVFIAMGAWRISRHHVLTRRSATIETLGSATVLCTDKTGTLTENQMSVTRLWEDGGLWRHESHELPESFHDLLETAVLASKPDASDPMERAIHALGQQHRDHVHHGVRGWVLEHEYPLSPQLLAVSHVWRDANGHRWVATKGAPEAVIGLCRLSSERVHEIRRMVDEFASQGMRVLGVARAPVGDGALQSQQHELQLEFAGLLALADPLRESVPAAVKECHQAGIRVVMITGDYPNTAFAIAREAGITLETDDHRVLMSGEYLSQLTDEALRQQVAAIKVYARIRPEQKLRIVEALKANGETVAMTGDGVNDAPALKAAHIGIAMGGRGTDVARESAALVLLKDDFASIVKAVAQGRRIYANLKKALAYIISIHIPIAGLAMLPLVFGSPMLFFPAHIAFLELIIDPTSCFVFESEPGDPELMKMPPRPREEALFSGALLIRSVIAGVALFIALAGLYIMLRHQEMAHDEIRAACFVALVAGGMLITLSSLARSRINGVLRALCNRAFLVIAAVSAVMLVVVLTVPMIRELFQFAMPTAAAMVAVGLSLMAMLVMLVAMLSVFRYFQSRRYHVPLTRTPAPH